MAWAVDHRQARVHQHLSEQLDAPLMFPPEHLAFLTFKDLDGLLCPCQQHGGQRSGEDEACSVGAHCVHQGAGAGDVAAHTAKCLAWKRKPITSQRGTYVTGEGVVRGFLSLARVMLTKGSRDDVHLVHGSVSVSDASSSGPIQAHGMNFIHKRNGTKLVGNITHLFQWAHSSCREHSGH